MELKNYFLLLKRHKLLVIGIPVIAMVATYFFVRYLPDSYLAKTQIITGLVDQSQQVMDNNANDTQGKRNDAFTNLIETMQLDKVLSQVSYQLLLHDLTEKKPFRKITYTAKGFNHDDAYRAVQILKQKQAKFELLNPTVPAENNIDSVISSLGYDPATLTKKNLKIFHSEGSDFINVDCETEKAALSSFVVNQLTAKFINYYTSNLNSGRNKSSEFISNLLNEKRTAMRNKIAELQAFKVKHNILDMDDEAKGVYGQISSLESYHNQASKDVIAYSGALKSIDNRFNPKDRKYLESTTTKVNGAIINTRERLRVMNNKYIENNFDPRYKKSIDSLQDAMSEQINQSTDKYISNPLATKDNLVQEKLKMENQLELARYSSQSLNRQLGSLKARLNSLVPAQAAVNSLERDIDIATKEYLDVQDKFNQASVANIIPVQLRQLHLALPGSKQPSKKLLLVAFSGGASWALCMAFVLLLFYLDNSVRNGEDLERITRIKVLGELNAVADYAGKALKKKEENLANANIQIFRNLLRNIRFEIDRTLTNEKVLAVTSLNGGQGKTLFSLSLAYAYAITNKKVLLIDGNFMNPNITETVKPKVFLEDYLEKSNFENNSETLASDVLGTGKVTHLLEMNNDTRVGATLNRLNQQSSYIAGGIDHISIIGNKGGDISLLEISNQQNINEKLDELKSQFDIIIIETGSLDTLSKSKEWMQFADKVISVFENNQTIKDSAAASIQYMRSLNGKMLGWVLNKVQVKHKETIAA